MNDAARIPIEDFRPDFLVVGGGTSGCVLAARLSEDSGCRVMLIEAGPDIREDSIPEEIRSAYPSKAFFTREFFFPDLMAKLGDVPSATGRERPVSRYEQARVLGGGSTINGLLGNRGAPADYDQWGQLGADGWNWETVLPHFRKLERDLDVRDGYHGDDGPIPIRRPREDELTQFVRANRDLLRNRGHADVEDQNGAWRDGVMRVTTTTSERPERASVATCYLTAAVRARPNLMVLTERRVLQLTVGEGAVTGALVEGGEGTVAIPAGQTIVCCGTINTPALLMRSGFGPRAVLERAGVEAVRALEGVGRNLQEHPAVGISCFVTPGSRHLDTTRHHTQAHFRFSSGLEGCPAGDMNVAMLARSAWHAVGGQIATYYLWINKAYSTGTVAIGSSDPDRSPEVDFRLLSDPRDLARMRDGFRRIAGLALDPALDAVRREVFPTVFSDRVRKVSRPGAWNAFQTAVLATILDMAPFARPALIRRLIAPVDIHSLMADDATLDTYLHGAVVGVWHCVGTCRMGRADDPLAVTDGSGRVHGVPGLRIGDASLMPAVPCANTNVPTIMVAERLSDLIKAEMAGSLSGGRRAEQTAA